MKSSVWKFCIWKLHYSIRGKEVIMQKYQWSKLSIFSYNSYLSSFHTFSIPVSVTTISLQLKSGSQHWCLRFSAYHCVLPFFLSFIYSLSFVLLLLPLYNTLLFLGSIYLIISIFSNNILILLSLFRFFFLQYVLHQLTKWLASFTMSTQ